jgi:GNAT superfamily N-acetyltransferase
MIDVSILEPTVRRAMPDDAEKIAALYEQLVGNSPVAVQPERIAQIGRDKNTLLLVCGYRDDVCGTALVSLCADVMFSFQPFAVVENVVVDASVRGHGFGRTLFKNIEAFCLSRDCSKIMLLSSAEREPAHRFFERAGFSGAAKRGFVKYRRDFAGVE